MIQTYAGKHELTKKNYIYVEYPSAKDGHKYEEVTTFEYMSVEGVDYIIETIKVDAEEAKRIWVLERKSLEECWVTMYAQVTNKMIELRGEDTALQYHEIYQAVKAYSE